MANQAQSLEIASWDPSLMHLDQPQKIDITGIGLQPMIGTIKKWHLPTKREEVVMESLEDLNISPWSKEYSVFIIQEIDDQNIASVSMDWYTNLKTKHKTALNREQMAEVIEGVHGLIKINNLKYLDDILKDTLDSSSSVEAIISLLRSSFSVRNKLNNWSDLFSRSKSWINEKGMAPEKALVGMY